MWIQKSPIPFSMSSFSPAREIFAWGIFAVIVFVVDSPQSTFAQEVIAAPKIQQNQLTEQAEQNVPAKQVSEDAAAAKDAAAVKEQQELHAKLEKYLSGTKWTGNFLMDGKDGLIKERYEILSAKKSEFGDKWNLVARIKYGNKDATLPLPPMDIKFAGNTPVITVDGLFFPGFGTFDARVVIRRGKYAGTWQHDKVGGHLFGTIEKMSDEESKAAQELLKKNKMDD